MVFHQEKQNRTRYELFPIAGARASGGKNERALPQHFLHREDGLEMRIFGIARKCLPRRALAENLNLSYAGARRGAQKNCFPTDREAAVVLGGEGL
jgi:hypothetical protein